MQQIVFIPGLSRCGTTWIGRWLKSHDEIQVFNDMFIYQNLKKSKCTDQEIRSFVLDYYYARTKRKIVVDKSPGSLALLNDYRGIFPESKIMIFYKYGPDYVYSFQHLPTRWPNHRPVPVERVVNDYIRETRYITLQDDENLIHLRYEDLLSEPTKMGKRICEFLNIQHTALIPWGTPANTNFDSYNPDRWKELGEENIEKLKAMNPVLERLGYPVV